MGWWITLGIVTLLAILPLGVQVIYNEDGPLAKIVLGPVKLTVFPGPKKEAKPRKQEKTKPEKKTAAEEAALPKPPKPPAEKKAPATPEQRQEVKQELTAPEDNATQLQLKGLKAVLKKLKDAQPDKEEMIAKIAVQTEGFTKISKSDCEELINRISAMLEGGQE